MPKLYWVISSLQELLESDEGHCCKAESRNIRKLLDSATPKHSNAPIVLYFHCYSAVQLQCGGTKLMEAYDIKGLDPQDGLGLGLVWNCQFLSLL